MYSWCTVLIKGGVLFPGIVLWTSLCTCIYLTGSMPRVLIKGISLFVYFLHHHPYLQFDFYTCTFASKCHFLTVNGRVVSLQCSSPLVIHVRNMYWHNVPFSNAVRLYCSLVSRLYHLFNVTHRKSLGTRL